MKKFLIKLLILASILLSIYLAVPISSYFSFILGTKFLNDKDYQKASIFLKFAFDKDVKNQNFLNAYVVSLVHIINNADAQKELIRISSFAPETKAGKFAENNVASIRNNVLSEIGDNYIDDAGYGASVLRWDTNKMPLKVFFGTQDSSVAVPQYYINSVLLALNSWISFVNSKISYKVVNDSRTADVIILFVPKIIDIASTPGSITVNSGAVVPIVEGNKLIRMEMRLRAQRPDNVLYNDVEIYNTALHEVGHLFGIMGHSYDRGDIMYPITYDKEPGDLLSAYKVRMLRLSNRDINTIKLLYKMRPEISNSESYSYLDDNLVDASVILGNEKSRFEKKILETQKYLQTVPSNPTGWISLGVAYGDAGNYNDSIAAFNQATAYADGNSQLSEIYYNIAVMNYKSKKYSDAIVNANKSLEYDPACDSAKELAAFVYLKQNDVKNSTEKYNELISKDPGNIDYSYNLAILNIKNYNFPEAGKVLNRLIAANPDAKNDSRFIKLRIFAMLFK